MKEDPMGEKHYVYSARTTEQGLALLSKARGEKDWDAFVNEAVCEHYGLDMAVVVPPKKEKPAKKAGGNQQPAEEKIEAVTAKERATEDKPAKRPAKGKEKK
jgi:hypothetical protein